MKKLMNPFAIPEDMKADCTRFVLERQGEGLGEIRGLYDLKRKNRIQIVDEVRISRGDWLKDCSSGRRYNVKDVEESTIQNFWLDTILTVQDEDAYRRERLVSSPVNFGSVTITGGNVGALGTFSGRYTVNQGISAEDFLGHSGDVKRGDLAYFSELGLLLKQYEETKEPVKKGAFAKFADFLRRNESILPALGQWLIQYLTR